MIRRLAALCLALLFLVLPAGSAAARPSAITLLRDELELRRDVDLAGTLDKVGKKQLKAVNAALKLLDKPADTLAAQVKVAASLGKSLAKAFPAEFPKALNDFQTLVALLASDLRQQAEQQYTTLAAAVPGIKSSVLHDRAEAQRVAAREELDLAAAAADPFEAFVLLKRAAKFIAKGRAYAAKDPFVETVSASLEFVPAAAESFVAQNTTVRWTASGPVLFIDGNSTRNGRFIDVQMSSGSLDPVNGTGTFNVEVAVSVGTDPVTISNRYLTSTGTLTLTTFDLAAKRITGTFSFTALDGFGPTALTLNATNGVVDVKDFTVE
jgi:hypothetical protein